MSPCSVILTSSTKQSPRPRCPPPSAGGSIRRGTGGFSLIWDLGDPGYGGIPLLGCGAEEVLVPLILQPGTLAFLTTGSGGSCTLMLPCWNGLAAPGRSPHQQRGGSSSPASMDGAQHVLVRVPGAVWNPDAAGGSAAVSGSFTPFPGRQPVASSFLQHSLCYDTGSGRDQREEPEENSQFWQQEPRATEAAGASLPWEDPHGERRAAVQETPGHVGSATTERRSSHGATQGQPHPTPASRSGANFILTHGPSKHCPEPSAITQSRA